MNIFNNVFRYNKLALLFVISFCISCNLHAKKKSTPKRKVKIESQKKLEEEIYVKQDKASLKKAHKEQLNKQQPRRIFLRPTQEKDEDQSSLMDSPFIFWSSATLLVFSAALSVTSIFALFWSSEEINRRAEEQLLLYPQDQYLFMIRTFSQYLSLFFIATSSLFSFSTFYLFFTADNKKTAEAIQ